MCMCMYVCMYVYICVCIYIYICIYVYVYMYIIVTKQHTCISVLPQTKNEQWFCYKDQEQALLNLLDFLYHEHTLLSFFSISYIMSTRFWVFLLLILSYKNDNQTTMMPASFPNTVCKTFLWRTNCHSLMKFLLCLKNFPKIF